MQRSRPSSPDRQLRLFRVQLRLVRPLPPVRRFGLAPRLRQQLPPALAPLSPACATTGTRQRRACAYREGSGAATRTRPTTCCRTVSSSLKRAPAPAEAAAGSRTSAQPSSSSSSSSSSSLRELLQLWLRRPRTPSRSRQTVQLQWSCRRTAGLRLRSAPPLQQQLPARRPQQLHPLQLLQLRRRSFVLRHRPCRSATRLLRFKSTTPTEAHRSRHRLHRPHRSAHRLVRPLRPPRRLRASAP